MKAVLSIILLLFSLSVFSQKSKTLVKENQKNVLTLDVDNFWDAYDHLKDCKSRPDSVAVIQKLVFDRATDGFLAFVPILGFSAEDYINVISKFPKYYQQIRKNTLVVKKVDKELAAFFKGVADSFPGFHPLKVCFTITPLVAAGNCNDKFLLIGSEIITSTRDLDLSEFGNSAMGKVLKFDTDIKGHIIYVVAHETIHQLEDMFVSYTENYELLFRSLYEGRADFLAEYFTKVKCNQSYSVYGEKHEKELWTEFLKYLAVNANSDDWMYNYDRVNDSIPADLGYYVGYKIVESYYKNSPDKKQALKEIIGMNDPTAFLEKSLYKKKFE